MVVDGPLQSKFFRPDIDIFPSGNLNSTPTVPHFYLHDLLFEMFIVRQEYSWNTADLTPRNNWSINQSLSFQKSNHFIIKMLLLLFFFRVKWRNDMCSALGGVNSALKLKTEDNIDVFIGPPCSTCKALF